MGIFKNNKATIVFAILIILIGVVSFNNTPNALLPDIETPEIDLNTSWPGKSAEELEQVLIAPLEAELFDIENIHSIVSTVNTGSASTKLKFHNGTDMDKAYIDVLGRINQVPGWPESVPAPQVFNRGNGSASPLVTLFFHSKEGEIDNRSLLKMYKEKVAPAIRTIPGVSSVSTASNPISERVDIEFDPEQLSRYSLSVDDVRQVLTGLVDQSGGKAELGSRDFQLHFKGQVSSQELEELAISLKDGHIVRLKEIAKVIVRLTHDWGYASVNGQRAMYIQLMPNLAYNTLDTIESIKVVLEELNSVELDKAGLALTMSRDDSIAINNALILVYGSVVLGILLACIFLYVYLRSWRTVLMVFLSIPVCLSIVALLVLVWDRSLNVISLAGVAISVGLILDASIISVENILRLKALKLSLSEAVARGVKEVRGALISSTVSSVIVFTPIMMLNSREGQLFEDLAFTISASLLTSLFAALVLVPALAHFLLSNETLSQQSSTDKQRYISLLTLPARNPILRYVVLFIGIPLSSAIAYFAAPDIDVLPNAQDSSVLAYVQFHEPMSVEMVVDSIASVIDGRIKSQGQTKVKYSKYGVFCYPKNCLLFFYPEPGTNFKHFNQWVRNDILSNIPETQSFIFRGSLLSFSIPDSRLTQLDIKGASLPEMQAIGTRVKEALSKEFKGARIREGTPLQNRSTRIEYYPNQEQLLYYGLNRNDVNSLLVALTSGLFLGDFIYEGELLPFYFKGIEPDYAEQVLAREIVLDQHGRVAMRDLVNLQYQQTIDSKLRVDLKNVVSLNITPSDDQAVGKFATQVKQIVGQILIEHGNPDVYVQYRGSADHLSKFLYQFSQILLASLLILLILMWFTLDSWRLAILVLSSIPLAFAGGILTLQLLNVFDAQNLDVITMIGFIILMGIVINNAILLATQYDQGLRAGIDQREAIQCAISMRKRPIYMSTGTTILGMFPLLINPGEGAEIYRGLASVIIGGMAFSMVFTLSYMSAALSLSFFKPSTLMEKDQLRDASVDEQI